MDNVNMPDKIRFHKQTNGVLYHDLMRFVLNQNKIENKISRLEKQLKQKKDMSKDWFNQVKSFEEGLITVGVNPQEKQPIKRILEEKEKTIHSLKKKLKFPIIDHPQTEEMVVLQKGRDDFHSEVLNLKTIVLQLQEEKEQLEQEEGILQGQKLFIILQLMNSLKKCLS